MGDTPTSPVNGFALATLCRVFADERSWPVVDVIGGILCPYGAGTPRSEH